MKHLSGSLFTKTPLRQTEASLSSAVGEYLDRKNIFHLRLNSGKVRVIHKNGQTSWVTMCRKGTPDRFFIYRGYHIFMELKMIDKKPTPVQLEVHTEIQKHGGFVTIVRRIEDVLELIKWIEART